MGGKSSSSTSQQTTSNQTTTTPDISGVVSGDAIQGETVNINGLTSDKIGDVLTSLINTLGHTVDIAGAAGVAAIGATERSAQNVTNPQATINGDVLNKVVPLAAIAAAAFTAWKVLK